jgi:acyl carrier protein
MDTQVINEKLQSTFRKVFNDENMILQDKMTANDVDNWDSLSHMILIAEIEKEFNIKFKLRDLNQMKNVGEMKTIILSKL